MAFTIDVEPANEVWLDLFPAKISVPADPWAGFQPAHEEYRVIVTDNHLYIIDDTIDGPKSILTDPLIHFEGTNKVGYTVVTELGTFHVTRAPNCGCGSRIRGLHPFAGIPQVRPK
jgi:hypothetical protein